MHNECNMPKYLTNLGDRCFILIWVLRIRNGLVGEELTYNQQSKKIENNEDF